ncbi:GSU2403 family nucleotidyltransferase fold protein [Acidovorax delafieldii]|uniref:GSU2403 family nucleotidyltransferase fold protein n=1 Tax=Acidovorax delafieldii TaxID=47920 RepID=UPI003ECC7932
MIQKLHRRGFFRCGGVLVGTQAFVIAGDMLGLRWNSSAKALDLGFALAEPSISIALSADFEIPFRDEIRSLDAGPLIIRELADLGQYEVNLSRRA